MKKKSKAMNDYIEKSKVETFKFWYQLICPLLWFVSVFSSIYLYDISSEYGVIAKCLSFLVVIIIFNFIMWLFRRYFYKKFPAYKSMYL